MFRVKLLYLTVDVKKEPKSSALLDFGPAAYLVHWMEGMFRLYRKVAVVSFGTGTANERISHSLKGRWRNMEYLYNNNWQGKTDILYETPTLMPIRLLQIQH